MADSQLQLMQRCEQRTDGRNILSHRNVCMKHSNAKKKNNIAGCLGHSYSDEAKTMSRVGIHQKALLAKCDVFAKKKSQESQ